MTQTTTSYQIHDANIYGSLLLLSFLSGIFLSVIHDAIKLAKALIFRKQIPKSNIFPKTKHSPTNTAKNTYPELRKQFPIHRYASLLLPKSQKKNEYIFTAVSDILFSLTAALVTVFLLFSLNSGETRFFVPLIMLIGYASYKLTLSYPVTLIAQKTVLALLKPLRLLTLPIKKSLSKLSNSAKHRINERIRKRKIAKYRTALIKEASAGFLSAKEKNSSEN